MKKVLFIVSILFVAVVSTACINNFAVQDLNNKAKTYMEKGDYTQAIERLKSSIDLDPSVFETHYNLAVAYTMAEDYVSAVDEYKKVIEMKPDNADSYYSLATAENNLAVDIEQCSVRMTPDGTFYKPAQQDFEEKYVLIDIALQTVKELYSSAIENYNKYLELKPDAEDKKDVEELIQKISDKLNSKEADSIQ